MTTKSQRFDLENFLPYLLNQAAEATSSGFHAIYRERYGMTRTQWRVLANLGKFGSMTARDICKISHIDKTKVSRAILALEGVGMLARIASDKDRRVEILSLTKSGKSAFAKLGKLAQSYDATLQTHLGQKDTSQLYSLLRRLVVLQTDSTIED